jgi:VanZ family protein
MTVGAVLVGVVVYLSLTPNPIEVPVAQGDKLGHGFAYATLMYWFAQIHRAANLRVMYAIAFVAMGIGLEFLQDLTDSRTFDVADMVADALGVGIGWAAAPPRSPNLLEFIEAVLGDGK